MLIISDKDTEVVLVNMRQNNEKTRHPWSEVLQVTSWLIKTDLSIEDSWRQQYDSEFPIKPQVAPVQPKKEPRKESKVTKARVEKPKTEKPKAEAQKTEEPQAEPKTEPETPKEQPAEPSAEPADQNDVEQPKEEPAGQPEETTEKPKEEPSPGQQGTEESAEENIVDEDPAEAPEEEPKEDLTENILEDDIVEKVEGTPMYVRRKYMAHLTDEELAEYLKKELKPHIMLSAESILRWLQEKV